MLNYYISLIEDPGDKELALSLYETYCALMHKIAYGHLKDSARSEDAVSDAVEKICKNIEQFRSLSCKKTRGLIVLYIRGICLNMLKRDKIIVFEELHDDYEAPEKTESLVIDEDSYSRLVEIIDTLDEKYKEVFRLKYYVGLTDKEIASALGISHTNASVRLHRAREIVKARLLEVGIYE